MITPTIVLLSGEIATGKSAVAKVLVDNCGFHRASTGLYLERRAKERCLIVNRDTLKTLGDTLDKENSGVWVAELVEEQCAELPQQELWLLDSVRRDFQVPWFRKRFQRVLHAHLTAPDEVKRERYERRRQEGGEYSDATSYEEAKAGPTEIQVHTLAKICDQLVDTQMLSPELVAVQILERTNEIIRHPS